MFALGIALGVLASIYILGSAFFTWVAWMDQPRPHFVPALLAGLNWPFFALDCLRGK